MVACNSVWLILSNVFWGDRGKEMSKGEGWGKEMSKGGRGGAGMEVSRDLVWWSRIKKYYQLSCSGLTRTSKRWFEL